MDLRPQPAARIGGGGRQIARSSAEPEPDDGYFGLHGDRTGQPTDG